MLVLILLGTKYLIVDVVLLVLLIGIWQGRIWARNLFFLSMLPFMLVFGYEVGGMIFGIFNGKSIKIGIYTILPFLILITFLKSSQEWFTAINPPKPEKKSGELSWQFQLIVIVVSMGIGFIDLGLYLKFNLLPLAKELIFLQDNHPTFFIKATYMFFSLNLDFFISDLLVLFPLGLILGSWKKEYRLLLWRLIIIGILFPLLLTYFFLDTKGDHIGMYFIVFLMNLLISGTVVYGGLVLGEKLKLYINTLKMKKNSWS
jgi:hypothetical protein